MRLVINLLWIASLLYVAYGYSPDMRDITSHWAPAVAQALGGQ